MPDVSIVIVNWNTAQLLLKCLRSFLCDIPKIPLDVWVIDNCSSDNSVEMVKSNFPQVNRIENDRNVGFSKANNQGIRARRADYYLLLNSDAFISSNAIEKMIQYMETNLDIGVLGCQLLYEDGSLQRSCQSFPSLSTELYQCFLLDKLFAKNREFGKYMMTYWAMDDTREVDVVMGAVMLVRARAFDQVGLLDENFFMYSEEVDLCYRIKKAGWKVVYLNSVNAIHIWGGSSRQIPAESMVRLYRSRVIFFRKHYGKTRTFLIKVIIFIETIIRVIGGFLGYFLLKKEILLQIALNYSKLLRTINAF